jgi:hypothetical protein
MSRRQQQTDLLITVEMEAWTQRVTPEARVEVKRLLRQLLAEYAAAVAGRLTDE